MKISHKIAATAALLASTALVAPAEASHFRGGALVPSVSASGLLTVTFTSFWRPTAVNTITPNGMTFVSATSDTSDSRFTKRTVVATRQLTGAGVHAISADDCCRVDGIQNFAGGSSTSWQMDSNIFWDGQNANTPILFDFSTIQPEVVRNTNYSDNLGAASGNTGTLSYNQALNNNGDPGSPFTAAPGYAVDATTGQLTIPAANTNTYADNPTGNIGADYIFSGNIFNSDGSSVEFEWLFDAVNVGAANLAPNVTSHIINALVGDTINQTVTGTDSVDAVADSVLLSLLSFVGPGINLAASFVPGAAGDPTSGAFSWDSTGSTPGTYIAQIRGSDGSLTDTGTIRINLGVRGTNNVPEPMTMGLLGAGLAGIGLLRRRRS